MKQTRNPKFNKMRILELQIFRLAKIYNSRPVTAKNLEWHNRVGKIQCQIIREKQKLAASLVRSFYLGSN